MTQAAIAIQHHLQALKALRGDFADVENLNQGNSGRVANSVLRAAER